MAEVQTREPVVFAIGDSLYFRRWFPEYSPANGWYLHYELLSESGQVQIWFNSVVDGTGHLVEIDNWAAGLDPTQEYILSGYAENSAGAGGGAERHQIYDARLHLTPDLGSGANAPDQNPWEVKMLGKVRRQIERLAENELQETDVARVRVLRVKRDDLIKQEGYWLERVNHLKRLEAVKNGRPDPNFIQSVFRIC